MTLGTMRALQAERDRYKAALEEIDANIAESPTGVGLLAYIKSTAHKALSGNSSSTKPTAQSLDATMLRSVIEGDE